ncbi:hypothetical protein [Halobacterium jilantaiense]|uniref:Polyprenyl synthetase n=1 Tax=Halobacterium jilantaiense TaxID=355548 RepID=A0A1I0NAC2_9EURY|nr:hypothetical protein [Halobacterium jilantaiense]SEV97856.1 hypothetical protein SAMN04487945_0702 [Halobacterium jilantaiense]
MTGRPRGALGRAAVDDGVADALADASGECLSVARRSVEDLGDRWYGRLVAVSHDAVADPPRSDAVLPAAVSVELLRGYCRLRASLLADRPDDRTTLDATNQSAALLAGDYLHAMAFLELQSLPRSAPDDGVTVLTDALESIRAGFSSAFAGPVDSDTGPTALVEQTVGSVADAAVRLGVSLSGTDHDAADSLAAAARDFATARGLRQFRDAVHQTSVEFPFRVDDAALREAADDRHAEASRRLRELRTDIDAEGVRRLARASDRHAAASSPQR